MAITYDGQGLFEDGKPWLPVSGEYQYSRGDRRSWYKEIAKMKALGIDTVASYVIWIHHEEEEGVFDFSGNKSLREFVGEVAAAKMKMCLRVGPWVHGEVRNGGFPDWIEHADFPTRCNSPEYLYYVTRYFKRLYEEVKGFFYADGGPIFAVQVENEYRGRKDNTGKQLPGYGDEHINKLIEILKSVGFDVPIYLATGWGDASTGEALPVWGAYCEAPWEQTSLGLPPANGYVFSYLPDDDAIGNDMGKRGAAFTITDKPYPFLTAELGGGIQVTKRRRPIVGKSDCAAIALVKFGSGAVGAHLFLRQSPADLGRGAECQAAVGNFHPLGHQGPGADDAVPADFRTVEHDGAHAHQGIIADGAAVENGPVADGAAPADTDGEARIGVEDAVVLDIGVGADNRLLRLRADHRAKIDAAARPGGNMAPDGGILRHKGGLGQLGFLNHKGTSFFPPGCVFPDIKAVNTGRMARRPAIPVLFPQPPALPAREGPFQPPRRTSVPPGPPGCSGCTPG